MGIGSGRYSNKGRERARRNWRWDILLAICALLICSSVGATAHVRFANVALIGPEGSPPLVELRLDGQTLVPELGYKSATGYFDVPAGSPTLSVWLSGSQIVERQLDLRDGRGYFFLVIGNGHADAPYDLAVQYETGYVLDATEKEQQALMLAPYPGYPRSDQVPRPAALYAERNCITVGGYYRQGNNLIYPPSAFPRQTGVDPPIRKPDPQSPDKAASTDVQPVNTCLVALVERSGASPFPPGMNPLGKLYTPEGGHRITEILVGNGGAQAPIEWWIVSQPDRAIDPVPIALGESAAGIWVAPDHPGLVLSLDVSNQLVQPTTGGGPVQVGFLVGILTGLDAFGNPRWNLLRSGSSITNPRQFIRLSEFRGSSADTVNEVALPGTTGTMLKFLSCTRASLKLDRTTSQFVVPRQGAIAGLSAPVGLSIALHRMTPVSGSCPN